MKRFDSSRYVLMVCLVCIAPTMSACSANSSAITPLQDTASLRAANSGLGPTGFKLLYSFASKRENGRKPVGTRLAVVNGLLFGTTTLGGKRDWGTVFTIDPTNDTEDVIYSFKGNRGATDGGGAKGSLRYVNGAIYGTTHSGGIGGGECYSGNGCGTIFSVSPSGSETVLHSFGGSGDGVFPAGGLVDGGGTFYGTTLYGGKYGDGIVFSSGPTGNESVVYSFAGPSADGAFPTADLTYKDGMIYGTTELGGSGCGTYGCGTVFSIDAASGKEVVIYSFSGGPDGAYPVSDLVDVKGTLYGVTAGFAQKHCSKTCGNVFAVTTAGKERVVYSFKGAKDGAEPFGDLLYYYGNFYGTTNVGGGSGCPLKTTVGCGTVFKLTASGKETVLHRFNLTDGFMPQTNLIEYGGAIYGTTSFGGADGNGTVFAITP
ncbi:MAG: choice-of-anchor tandem repeat GloVer-containing protein [Candidatus Cybelea sp.]